MITFYLARDSIDDFPPISATDLSLADTNPSLSPNNLEQITPVSFLNRVYEFQTLVLYFSSAYLKWPSAAR